MGKHSVADAKNHLSSLIDRALDGEDVVITRHGRPVVALQPLAPKAQPMTAADLEWLRAHRVTPTRVTEDSVTLVRRMRDEEDH